MNDCYILDGQTPVPVDTLTWARWFETAGAARVVAKSERCFGDGVKVSTVFLGLDHNFGEGPPLIFETMIFGGEYDQWQERCSTWDQALAMHRRACDKVGL